MLSQKPNFMYILDYKGKKAGVMIDFCLHDEFDSHEDAKDKIDSADSFQVLFPHGWRDFDSLRKEDLIIKDGGTRYNDL